MPSVPSGAHECCPLPALCARGHISKGRAGQNRAVSKNMRSLLGIKGPNWMSSISADCRGVEIAGSGSPAGWPVWAASHRSAGWHSNSWLRSPSSLLPAERTPAGSRGKVSRGEHPARSGQQLSRAGAGSSWCWDTPSQRGWESSSARTQKHYLNDRKIHILHLKLTLLVTWVPRKIRSLFAHDLVKVKWLWPLWNNSKQQHIRIFIGLAEQRSPPCRCVRAWGDGFVLQACSPAFPSCFSSAAALLSQSTKGGSCWGCEKLHRWNLLNLRLDSASPVNSKSLITCSWKWWLVDLHRTEEF